MRLSKAQQNVLDNHGQDELDYHNNMTKQEKIKYREYIKNHPDKNPSPSYWYNNLKKNDDKMLSFVRRLMGERAGEEYKTLEYTIKKDYYIYLYSKEKFGMKNTLLTPREWVRVKEENKLNTDFAEIAERFKVSEEMIRTIYKEAIKKIKKFIDKHPEYKELKEYLWKQEA